MKKYIYLALAVIYFSKTHASTHSFSFPNQDQILSAIATSSDSKWIALTASNGDLWVFKKNYNLIYFAFYYKTKIASTQTIAIKTCGKNLEQIAIGNNRGRVYLYEILNNKRIYNAGGIDLIDAKGRKITYPISSLKLYTHANRNYLLIASSNYYLYNISLDGDNKYNHFDLGFQAIAIKEASTKSEFLLLSRFSQNHHKINLRSHRLYEQNQDMNTISNIDSIWNIRLKTHEEHITIVFTKHDTLTTVQETIARAQSISLSENSIFYIDANFFSCYGIYDW
jgi:hypothetical protein